jgi:hypothetical protein
MPYLNNPPVTGGQVAGPHIQGQHVPPVQPALGQQGQLQPRTDAPGLWQGAGAQLHQR